jgi:type II secretory pathway pseudopilin PulG
MAKKKFIGHWTFSSGFSLIELLLYMGLLLVLIGILSSLFSSILDSQLETNSATSLQQDGQFLLAKLTEEVRQADGITTPGTLGQSSSTLQITTSGLATTYTLDGSGNFTASDDSGTEQLNSYLTTISGLTFTRNGNVGGKNSVTVSFTINSDVIEHSGLRSQTYTTTIALR